MKMKCLLRIFQFATLMILLSCNKDSEVVDDKSYPEYIVFGQFFTPTSCFSSESCVEIYKLESGNVWEDVNDFIPEAGTPANCNFSSQLGQDNYVSIEGLFRNGIPKSLTEMESGLIGNPQSGSSQKFYFEYKSKDVYKFWILDPFNSTNVPNEVVDFISKIQQAVFFANS
jgi:hypothetical protein